MAPRRCPQHDDRMSLPTPSRSPLHGHRPRRHRGARPGRGDRLLPRHLRHGDRARGDQRGAGRPRGDGRGRRLRIVHPAARPAHARVDDRQVPRPLRARRAAGRLPRRGRRRPSPQSSASAASGSCTTSPAAAPPAPASTSSTPRTPAASWSSSSQPACPRGSANPSLTLNPNPLVLRSDGRQRTVVTSPSRRKLPCWHRRRAVKEGNLRRLGCDCAWLLQGVLCVAQTRPTGANGVATLSRVQQIRDAILAGDTTGEEYAALAGSRVLPGRDRPQGRGRPVRGPGEQGQGPAQVAARRRRAGARARSGRGAGGGDGQRDQLQHRLDEHLRAGVDVRVPRALRPAQPAVEAARPALPRRRLRPGRRGAAHRPGRAPVAAGRRGRRPLPERRAGEPRRPQRHDARPRAADLGLRDELRRASPSSPWSSPTS